MSISLKKVLLGFIIGMAISLTIMLVCKTAFGYDVPSPNGYATDTSGKLNNYQLKQLNTKLTNINQTTKNEIAVLIVDSLKGESIEEVAYQVFKTWGIGKAGLDNGVLLVLAIKDRKSRITTGKGVEGDLTDIQSSDILSHIKPQLKAGDFYGALDLATTEIANTLESRKHSQAEISDAGAKFNQPLPNTSSNKSTSCMTANPGSPSSGDSYYMFGLVVFVFMVIFITRHLLNRAADKKQQSDIEFSLVKEKHANSKPISFKCDLLDPK